MSLFEFFKGIGYFYLNLFKVNEYSQKHKSSKDYNSTYLSLNRYFYLEEAETVPELENQANKPSVKKIGLPCTGKNWKPDCRLLKKWLCSELGT